MLTLTKKINIIAKKEFMERRSFIKNTSLTLAAFTLLSKSSLASFLTDPAYKVKMLTDKIGIFTEKGGTIMFLLGKKDVVVVDAQFPDSAQHCIDEIKKVSAMPFAFLINTHHHGDHTAGNIAFKDIAKNVVAHTNSLKNQKATAVKNNNEKKQLYPDTTFDKTWTKKLKGEKITLTYFGSGHTDGDVFVHFEDSKIVHTGDLVFNRKYPYIDKGAGASITSWIKVLEDATSKYGDKVTYVCGHAGEGYEVVLTKTDVLAFKSYLSNLVKYTTEKIAAGVTKEDYMKTKEIPGSTDWKGEGISRSLEAAWAEFKK
jgi:cyclase